MGRSMTHDITLPIDGKLSLTADDHQYRVPKVQPKPLAPRAPRTTAAKDAQAERHRALVADGCFVKVGLGSTVFRFSGNGCIKSWDGHR
jgi:hypothetical protein